MRRTASINLQKFSDGFQYNKLNDADLYDPPSSEDDYESHRQHTTKNNLDYSNEMYFLLAARNKTPSEKTMSQHTTGIKLTPF